MRFRDIAIIVISLAVAATLLFVAGRQIDPINAQRQKMGLIVNAPLENAPPALAFATVAMGAFRGLVVDILWMRADKLKEEGQFFDAKQLAEWITIMQPRFASVWVFQAWNLSYNISVTIPASQPDQRWRWVKTGYELLRDKGIPMNPKSIDLYHELARIFQHKLGGVSDDAHRYYKLQLAEAIGPLLQSEDNGLRSDDYAYLDALIAAPTEWSQVASDPTLMSLIQSLHDADETFALNDSFVQSYLSLRQDPNRFKPAALEMLNRYRGTTALKRFDIFAKAYELRHTWKMEPALMKEVSLTYGPVDYVDPNKHYPMDWRHPDCHAIYWGLKGLKVAAEKKDHELSSVELNTDRIVAHSLQNLFRYGKLTIFEGPANRPAQGSQASAPATRKDVFLSPDLRYFNSYDKFLLMVADKYGDDPTRKESLLNGHRNMLKNAVLSFYLAGLETQALKVYNEMRRMYPRDEFKVSLEQYVVDRFVEERQNIGIYDARESITTLLMDAYRFYALRDDDAAAGREQLAQQVYDYYNKQYGDTERIDLPPMRILKYVAMGEMLNNDAYPAYIRQGLLDRIQKERPELFKQLEQTDEEVRRQMQEAQEQQQ
jgi:hypothetical protein